MIISSNNNLHNNFAPVRSTMATAVGLVLMGYGTLSFAQLGPDAGALQQQLQREADQNRVTPPPESFIKEKPTPSK